LVRASIVWFGATAMRGDRIFLLISSHHFEEIMLSIFSQVQDYRELALYEQTCQWWRKLARRECVWHAVRLRVWNDKSFVPIGSIHLSASGMSKKALALSVIDSRRIEITAEELSSFDFYFRFKGAAGPYWTRVDPYWNGDKVPCIRFGRDGRVVGFPEVEWEFCDGSGEKRSKSGSVIRVKLRNISEAIYVVSRHVKWGFIIHVRLKTKCVFICSKYRLLISHSSAEYLGCLLLVSDPPG
jgi:hypothetical protein